MRSQVQGMQAALRTLLTTSGHSQLEASVKGGITHLFATSFAPMPKAKMKQTTSAK